MFPNFEGFFNHNCLSSLSESLQLKKKLQIFIQNHDFSSKIWPVFKVFEWNVLQNELEKNLCDWRIFSFSRRNHIWIVLLRFLEVVKDLQNLYKYIYPRNMETLITILPCPSNWRNVACPRLHRLFRSPWNPRWPMNSPSSYYRQFLGLPYSMTSLSDCVNFGRTLDLEKIQKKNSNLLEKNCCWSDHGLECLANSEG